MTHVHDERNGIDYTLHGDYFFPEIFDPELEDHRPIGKWGLLYESYLKENKPSLYAYLLLSGKLHNVLADLSEQATERWNTVHNQMMKAEQVTEVLKASDQLEWIRRTYNIIARCDEIIKAELIFC